MIRTSDIKIGQIVQSKAGRDKDDFFAVLEIVDQEYVLLVNGRRRNLANPKKKKMKHLMVTKKCINLVPKSKMLNDSYIRRALAKEIEK
ncbi:MAG: KOW domain-containing RNA-binding protein [Tissierellia bacterium]|nr:KOW domain-containing RNA-binding protein [Tissierellia bacterium]